MYQNRRGVELDYEKAVYWYSKAATQNHPRALYALGWLYEYGRGVAYNKEKAARYFQAAFQYGAVDARIHLTRL